MRSECVCVEWPISTAFVGSEVVIAGVLFHAEAQRKTRRPQRRKPEVPPLRSLRSLRLCVKLAFPNARLELLGDALALQEEEQVVAAAGLRVRARHVEPTERVYVDERARALT